MPDDSAIKVKVVVNRSYGGFSLSAAAIIRMRELGSDEAKKSPLFGESYEDGSLCKSEHGGGGRSIPRHDPILVRVVEEMGRDASGRSAKLEVVEITVPYVIDEYDGMESVGVPQKLVYY